MLAALLQVLVAFVVLVAGLGIAGVQLAQEQEPIPQEREPYLTSR